MAPPVKQFKNVTLEVIVLQNQNVTRQPVLSCLWSTFPRSLGVGVQGKGAVLLK